MTVNITDGLQTFQQLPIGLKKYNSNLPAINRILCLMILQCTSYIYIGAFKDTRLNKNVNDQKMVVLHSFNFNVMWQ